jgi:ATP-dependent 26S proteasome regulatory subunit
MSMVKFLDFPKIASSLDGATGSDIEKICLDAIKSVILNNQNNLMEVDLNLAIRRYMERKSIVDPLFFKQVSWQPVTRKNLG